MDVDGEYTCNVCNDTIPEHEQVYWYEPASSVNTNVTYPVTITIVPVCVECHIDTSWKHANPNYAHARECKNMGVY